MRRTVDRLFHQAQRHQMPPVRPDALIASTHGRFDGAVRRARPAKISHDPSVRIRRLRRVLIGTTALVAVALVGTLLVAAPPVFARGGNGGANGGSGTGGQGASDKPTDKPAAGGVGTTGGGGGGGGSGFYGFGGNGGNDSGESSGYGKGGWGVYSPTGGTGGTGLDGGKGNDGGGGGGGGGGGHFFVTGPSGSTLPTSSGTGGNGGRGGDGSSEHFHDGGGGGGGGAGGFGAVVTGSGSLGTIGVNLQGGTGGNGGNGGDPAVPTGGYAGEGGTGGTGLMLTGISQVTVGASSTITGGSGGYGGTGFAPSGSSPAIGGTGGGGGAGVYSANGASITNYGKITGGTGGPGGPGGRYGSNNKFGPSGTGGTGVSLSGSSTTLTNHGTITGGTGGWGGGTGGNGVSLSGSGATLTNYGTINGGNGGIGNGGGAGGAGVSLSNGASKINHGTINNGHGGDSGPAGPAVFVNGGTLINSGTIIGGGGGDAITFAGGNNRLELRQGSNIQGAVNAVGGSSDTLALGGEVDGAFDISQVGDTGQHRGFEHFEKSGGSTWTLTGTAIHTGDMTVNGGALIVNGSISSSSRLTVNGGGLVGGSGTLPATTIDGGTLSPGNSIGTINVQGNLALSTAATYLVEVSPAAADSTNVTGTATLGGTVRVVAAPGVYTPTTYAILRADGGVSGTETLSVSVSSVFLDPTLSNDTNNVFLTLTALPFNSAARTPNQHAVADALQVGGVNSTLGAAVFNQATAADARRAFDALSGEVHASVGGVLVNDSRYVRSAVLGRLRQAPYAGAGGPLAALGIGGPALAYQPSPQEAYAADLPAKAPPPGAPPPRSSGLTFWTQGFGAWGTFDGDGNAASVKRSLGGALVGLDGDLAGNGLADRWRVGFAAGYSQSDVNIGDRASRATVDSGHVALYGGGSFGAWNLRGGAAYAHHEIDTRRRIMFPGFVDRATADYSGGTGQVFGELGYGVNLGRLAVEPFAGLAWVHVKTNSFTEGDGVAALRGSSITEEVGYSTLGARFATTFALVNGAALTPRASFAWQHAFNDVTPEAVLAFLQNPGVGFSISGVPLARDSALVEAGLDLNITPQMTLGVSYLGQLASSTEDHAIKGQFTWRF
ncbi:autotransporter domain-containing protein [Bradyrhizobium sp. LHD-71]|uniref:autotransporter family protein n=1 Tax=Bradyrhizobium sp. LHD-71 TaxID=3072141 RepID=UPI00280CCA19|nr:autotransporter domain-containing protein [Bradyrhizobium sp. LHD-71]MDQ8726478.1 autotransporter domain-containing protein [Bradyrhizobium sp. LHD-71]